MRQRRRSQLSGRFSEYAEFIAKLAVWGGDKAVEFLHSGVEVFTKADGTRFTNAEQFIQSQIGAQTQRKFGSVVRLFGEEDMSMFPQAGRNFIASGRYAEIMREPNVFLVDPINDTESYTRKLPGWDVTLSCLHYGKPKIGVVRAPLYGNLMSVAEIGVGAYVSRNTRSIKYKPVIPKFWSGKYEDLEIGIGFQVRSHPRYWPFLSELYKRNIRTREIVSTSIGLVTACDLVDAHVQDFTFGWDVAAGMVALTACGRSCQIFEDFGKGPRPLGGLPVQSYNPDREKLSVQVIGGHSKVVGLLTELWQKSLKGPSQTNCVALDRCKAASA